MGGGVELEFPGYHIFTSQIMIMTGLPNYLAQSLVVAFFSSAIVLAIFLVTRVVWNESIGIIVAFFVAISRTDIEILCWGGYPNIIALFLIPTIFYLFLKKSKLTSTVFVLSASLVASSILLTHSLSAAIFLGIISTTFLFVLAFPKKFKITRRSIVSMALPIFVGGILILPFLATAIQPYLSQSATLTGSSVVTRALLEYRTISPEMVIGLFACVVLLFSFSKEHTGKFFLFPTFLIIIWLFVPIVLTLDYVYGLYLDSVRFLYFLIYPVLTLFALIADYSARNLARILSNRFGPILEKEKTNRIFNSLRSKIIDKVKFQTLYTVFLVGILLVVSVNLPIFCYPWEGVNVQKFYQVMDNNQFQGIEWAKQNTREDSVFVSDMGYGWWLAGLSQRPTLTDIDFQAITLDREVNISKDVSLILDTDYMVDNGYIQVREDGGYLGRHNPLFLADLDWTNKPYAFLQFNSSEIILLSHDENSIQTTSISELAVKSMGLLTEDYSNPFIIVDKESDLFSYSQVISIEKGKLFANMTINVLNKKPNVSLDWLNIVIESPGELYQQFNNTLAIVDPNTKMCGQLIFEKTQPTITNFNPQNPGITQLSYNLQGKSKVEIQILVGLFSVTEEQIQNSNIFNERLAANLQKPAIVPDLAITTFDYVIALQKYNVSYVANCDFNVDRKFSDDPNFSLAFINNEIAFFKVEINSDNDMR